MSLQELPRDHPARTIGTGTAGAGTGAARGNVDWGTLAAGAVTQFGGRGGARLVADFQTLATIPQTLTTVKNGCLALKPLISTPSAAAATGSPAASAAIIALGLELVMFIVQSAQAVDHDVDAIRRVLRSYQETEQGLSGAVDQGAAQLEATPAAPHPNLAGSNAGLNGGIQSCTARGVFEVAARGDDVVRGIRNGADRTSAAARAVVEGQADAVAAPFEGAAATSRAYANRTRSASSATAAGLMRRGRIVEGSAAYLSGRLAGAGADAAAAFGDGVGYAARGVSNVATMPTRIAGGAAAVVGAGARAVEPGVGEISRRADDQLTLDSSCDATPNRPGLNATPNRPAVSVPRPPRPR